MAHFILVSVLAFFLFSGLVSAEIADSKDQNKPFKVLEKDVEDAKERWIQNEDWGDDDMMQHPIDEGPRRVSTSCCSYVFLSGPLRISVDWQDGAHWTRPHVDDHQGRALWRAGLTSGVNEH